MLINLVNCQAHLASSGIDISTSTGKNDLTTQLSGLFGSDVSWGYSNVDDAMSVFCSLNDGDPIPDLSAYGEVAS